MTDGGESCSQGTWPRPAAGLWEGCGFPGPPGAGGCRELPQPPCQGSMGRGFTVLPRGPPPHVAACTQARASSCGRGSALGAAPQAVAIKVDELSSLVPALLLPGGALPLGDAPHVRHVPMRRLPIPATPKTAMKMLEITAVGSGTHPASSSNRTNGRAAARARAARQAPSSLVRPCLRGLGEALPPGRHQRCVQALGYPASTHTTLAPVPSPQGLDVSL